MIKNQGTYVSVKVKNNDEFYNWFLSQGVEPLNKSDLHCTIAYSKKEFERIPNKKEIIINPNQLMKIEPLGDEGAIVLKFNSDEMQNRFDECIKSGATFDYDSYKPHITITYNGKGLDLSSLKLPNFNIVLNDETVEPLDLEWKSKISNDKLVFKDSYNDFTKYIDEDTGFLHINGVVARTGLQSYLGAELGDMENPTTMFNVYRPREEVLKEESLSTYANAPITDDHPNTFVTVDNASELIKGSVASYETYNKDGIDYIKAQIVVTDKDLINKVINGKMELSAGYSQNLVKEKGEFEGVTYDYIQTNIKINHVALVDSARCGQECKLVFDSNSIIVSENITKGIDSMEKQEEIKTPDAELPFDIKELAMQVAEFLKMEKTEEEEMIDEKMPLEEETKNVDSLIDAKVDALLTAKELGLNVNSSDSVVDIKKAIIATKSDMALDGVCDAGIDTAYKMVKSQIAKDSLKQEEIKKSQSNAFDGLKHGANDSKFADLKDKEI